MPDPDSIEEAPETPDADETQPEPEPADTGEPEAPEAPEPHDTTPDPFFDVFPELAGKDVPPETRELLLTRELTTARASQASVKDATEEPTPPSPQLAQFGAYDDENIDRALNLLQEGDTTAAARMFRDIRDSHRSFVDTVGTVLDRHNERLDELALPTHLEDALPEVRGATREDIRAAARIMGSGETKSPKLALELVMLRRQASAPPPPAARDADDSARRKAAAIAASKRASGGEPEGSVQVGVGASEAEFIKLMTQEVADGGGSLINSK